MSVTTTVKKVVTDQTYATLGATDLAAEALRGYSSQLAAIGAELEPKKVQARVLAAPGDAQTYYVDLTKRGEALVTRVRNQQATKDLIGQAESSVARAKGVVTTARKAVSDLEASAKRTLTIGRNEATKAADAVTDSVDVDVDTAKAKKAVSTSAKKTATAAKGTTTTAKKGASRTRSAAKGASTSAKKTASASTKATTKAAGKTSASSSK